MSSDFSFSNLMKEGLKVKKSLVSTGKNFYNAVSENKKITSDRLNATQRLNICNQCPNFSKNLGRCDVCGCFVSLKVKLEFETCPLGKW